MNTLELITEQALKNAENFEVAYQTYLAFKNSEHLETIRQRFEDSLEKAIKLKLGAEFPFDNFKWEKDSDTRCCLYIDGKKDSWQHEFIIGFDEDEGRLFFTIHCNSEDDTLRNAVYAKILEKLNEGENSCDQWWSYVKEPYLKWASNYEALKQFAFGDEIAINYFTQRFIQFIEVIDQEFSE